MGALPAGEAVAVVPLVPAHHLLSLKNLVIEVKDDWVSYLNLVKVFVGNLIRACSAQ